MDEANTSGKMYFRPDISSSSEIANNYFISELKEMLREFMKHTETVKNMVSF